MKLSEINWGDDSAERDPLLLEYFVSSDAFKRLKAKSKNIVIGRKGSGKSALRKKLEQAFESETNTHIINLSPKFNSIKNILNDNEISTKFNHEIFFQHTWLRQILLDCLCVIGHKAKGKYAADSMEFARNVSKELNRTSKDLVENVTEVISKIKIKAENLGELGISLERELRNVAEIDALEHHFSKIAHSGANFVILVDDLDLGWNNSQTSNNLLLGLLTTINHVSSISKNAHICIFLREDVYQILITKTQHSDKYRNVERIRWSKDELIKIINERINFNLKKNNLPRETNPFNKVFPETIGTSNTDNWMYERTLGRPRELIQLVRQYTETIAGEEPSDDALKGAEQTYSTWKLEDLSSEYSNQYPGLDSLFQYYKAKHYRNKYHLSRDEIDKILIDIMIHVEIKEPWYCEAVKNTDTKRLLEVLYEIGFIGDFILGGEGGSKVFYSHSDRHEPRFEEIQIHPCFRKAVNTVERIRAKQSTEKGDIP